MQTEEYKQFNQSLQSVYQQLNNELDNYDINSNSVYRFNDVNHLYNLKHLKDSYSFSNQQFEVLSDVFDRLENEIYRAYLYYVYKV